MGHYSAIKKNEIMPLVAIWLELEIIILSEVSKKEKDKYHMIALICGNWKTKMWHIYKAETDLQIVGNRLMVAKAEGETEKLGVWDQQIHATIYKTDDPQGPTV